MKAGPDFQSSKPGFSRLWCDTCQSETQHQSMTCGCGTKHVAYPVKNISMLLRTKARLSR